LLLTLTVFGSAAVAQGNLREAWIESMNACEKVITDQRFDGFEGYAAAEPIFDVEARFVRAFQHSQAELISSAVSNGSEWFLCVVTGEAGVEIADAVASTLSAQIAANENETVMLEDHVALAPVRVICGSGGRLTSVFAYFTADAKFRIAATNRLPNGVESPCSY